MNNKAKATDMKEDGRPALVPRLRFPEFQSAGEWVKQSLGGVARLRNGYAFKSAEYVEGGSFQIITIANVQQGHLELESTKRIAALPPDIQQHQVLCCGDILISMTGNVGRVCRVTAEDLLLNQRVGKLIPVAINNAFFYQLLQRDEFRNTMQLKAAGGAQGNLSGGDITEYGFTIPTEPDEQQRIADCLTTLDELIADQSQKIEALAIHKKGLMQQLFPREGETQPRIRFPEFQNAGEWSEEKLDDLVHLQDGFAFKSTDFVKAQEDATQVIRITDINNKNINEDKVYIPTAFLERNKLGKYCVDDGDLLLSLTGAAGFNFFFWNGGPAAINQRTAKVTSKKKSGHALLGLLEPLIHARINERGEGQNNNLSKEFLSTIVLFVPEPVEQQRIADCLTSLDDLIGAQTQKLAALKTHKKGLMQQLFPSPEEVEA